MNSRTTILMLYGLLLFQLTGLSVAAQVRDVDRENNKLMTKQFKTVVLEGQIRELFSKLALEEDIPIGLELDSEKPDMRIYRIQLTNGTLPELLDSFVKQNGKYKWFIENGVVDVFPHEGRRDPFLAELLSVRVQRFVVEKGTSSWAVQELLCGSPEIKALMDANGVEPAGSNFIGLYIPQLGREFAVDVSNLTTKEILNHIIKESPVARIWIASHEPSARTLRLAVSSRPEVETLKN